MTRNGKILLLSLALLYCSCSTVKLKHRNGLDFHLDANSFDKLSGDYNNSRTDTAFRRTLYSNFSYDTVHKQKDLLVKLTVIDKNKIQLRLLENETVIDSLTIKGKYRRGYFKVKRETDVKFIAGPFLWAIVENTKYLGLTNDNNLVIIHSGSSGLLLLIAFPIFAAGGGQTEIEYERH